MSEKDPAGPTPAEAREARRQLIIKAAAAGVAVLALVGVLVMLENNKEPEPPPVARTVTPMGVSPPVEQSPSLAEATTRALRNSSEAAELQSAVMAEQQASSVAAPVPEESAEPLGVPPPRPLQSQASSPRRQESSGRLVLGQTPQTPRAAASSAAPQPAVPAAPVRPLAPQPAAASSAAPANFLVQVGVFSNPGNAEELRAKLVAAGIPTQIETRVQVGPFATRQEALAAQSRLKALGLDAGMVVPARH